MTDDSDATRLRDSDAKKIRAVDRGLRELLCAHEVLCRLGFDAEYMYVGPAIDADGTKALAVILVSDPSMIRDRSLVHVNPIMRRFVWCIAPQEGWTQARVDAEWPPAVELWNRTYDHPAWQFETSHAVYASVTQGLVGGLLAKGFTIPSQVFGFIPKGKKRK